MVKGTRFYYNDGATFALEDCDSIGAIEIKAPVHSEHEAQNPDVILEFHATEISNTENYVIVYLTKQAVEDMITYLKNTLEGK